MPTLEAIGSGRVKAKAYFVHFLQKAPPGTIREDIEQSVGDNVIIHSGLYDFDLGSARNRKVAHARFTLVWIGINGE